MINGKGGFLFIVGTLSAFCAVEAIIGFKNKNVHLINDCVASALLLISMLVSFKAEVVS